MSPVQHFLERTINFVENTIKIRNNMQMDDRGTCCMVT